MFDIITEEFLQDIAAMNDLIGVVHNANASSKSRVASINSSTLLLAATFEEYIREMGRAYAREVVSRTDDTSRLPRKLSATAWKRTLDQLSRAKIDTGGTPLSLQHISVNARRTIDAILQFLDGDKTQDIYSALIHNDNNMRPAEINSIFSICDLSDICKKTCEHQALKNYFNDEDEGVVHGHFMRFLNDFMEKRNEIAHSLNAVASIGPTSFVSETDFFKAFAQSLADCLPRHLPQAHVIPITTVTL